MQKKQCKYASRRARSKSTGPTSKHTKQTKKRAAPLHCNAGRKPNTSKIHHLGAHRCASFLSLRHHAVRAVGEPLLNVQAHDDARRELGVLLSARGSMVAPCGPFLWAILPDTPRTVLDCIWKGLADETRFRITHLLFTRARSGCEVLAVALCLRRCGDNASTTDARGCFP
jgi:hypothetical protein